MQFGLGLHVGTLMFGNIGVPGRMEFTVIGSVANEVSRLENLTKDVGAPVLASAKFVELLDSQWERLGNYPAQGLEHGIEIFRPSTT